MHDRLIIEIDVAGVENGLAFDAQKYSGRAKHVSGIPEFEGYRATINDPITGRGVGLTVPTAIPALTAAIDFAMAKKWIDREAEVLALPRHDVNGIVEEK